MGKKGYDPHLKQSSTVSATEALRFLLEEGFGVAAAAKVLPEKGLPKAYKKDIMSARRQFGENAAISITGRSVQLVGNHAVSEAPVEILMPLSGMLGIGEINAIELKTGYIIK